jgi:hypothetical protein
MKFSEVVYSLAQEEEPHQTRANFNAAGGTTTYEGTTKPVIRCEAMKKATLTSAMKDKYIVRTRHQKIGGEKFIPVNAVEAKRTVKSVVPYETEEYLDEKVYWRRNKKHDRLMHGSHNFLATSPVTQNIE